MVIFFVLTLILNIQNHENIEKSLQPVNYPACNQYIHIHVYRSEVLMYWKQGSYEKKIFFSLCLYIPFVLSCSSREPKSTETLTVPKTRVLLKHKSWQVRFITFTQTIFATVHLFMTVQEALQLFTCSCVV